MQFINDFCYAEEMAEKVEKKMLRMDAIRKRLQKYYSKVNNIKAFNDMVGTINFNLNAKFNELDNINLGDINEEIDWKNSHNHMNRRSVTFSSSWGCFDKISEHDLVLVLDFFSELGYKYEKFMTDNNENVVIISF